MTFALPAEAPGPGGCSVASGAWRAVDCHAGRAVCLAFVASERRVTGLNGSLVTSRRPHSEGDTVGAPGSVEVTSQATRDGAFDGFAAVPCAGRFTWATATSPR